MESNITNIIFNSKDPLGNGFVLKKETLESHIAGEKGHHPDRHYLNNETNLSKISNIIQNPSLILMDKKHDNRVVHMGVTRLEGQNKTKCVKIVSEEVSRSDYKVITIIASSNNREPIIEGRVLYDMYDNE